MKCPRCDAPELQERERDGITIDLCGQCRGIWLDRGELERLISRAVADDEDRDRPRDPDDDHHRRERGGGEHHRWYRGRTDGRKRRWYESLLDVFD